MIRQRPARHLASGEAAAVGEDGGQQPVDRAFLLQRVQALVDAFVDERSRADLDADGLLLLIDLRRLHQRGRRHRRQALEKVASIHYRLLVFPKVPANHDDDSYARPRFGVPGPLIQRWPRSTVNRSRPAQRAIAARVYVMPTINEELLRTFARDGYLHL